jgi:hypothetical protein
VTAWLLGKEHPPSTPPFDGFLNRERCGAVKVPTWEDSDAGWSEFCCCTYVGA